MQPESLAPLKGGPYQVRVFVGSQQAKGRVPFEYVLAAQQLAAQTEFVLIEGSGRNALDFHIAYYLGQYIAADPKAAFRVIAKDTGYDVLIQHLQKQGIDCLRHPGLEDALHGSSPTPALPRAEQTNLVHEQLERMKAAKPKSLKTRWTTIAKTTLPGLTDAETAKPA